MTASKTLLGLLIIAGGMVYYLLQSETNQVENELFISTLSADESAINALTRVVVSQGDQQFDMREKETQWYLNNGFYVRMDSLFKMIQALKNARLIEAKTANSDNFPALSLTKSDLRIRLYQDQEVIADVILGQTSSTPGTRFVRYFDDTQSWLASGLNDLSSSEDIWQLTMIIDVPENQVQAIEWTAGDTLSLIKNNETGLWQHTDEQNNSQPLDQDKIKTLAASLSGFRIQEAREATSDSEQPLQTFIFGLQQGRKITLAVYGDKENAFVRVNDSQQPMRYQDWQLIVPDYKLSTLFMEPSAVLNSQTDTPNYLDSLK